MLSCSVPNCETIRRVTDTYLTELRQSIEDGEESIEEFCRHHIIFPTLNEDVSEDVSVAEYVGSPGIQYPFDWISVSDFEDVHVLIGSMMHGIRLHIRSNTMDEAVRVGNTDVVPEHVPVRVMYRADASIDGDRRVVDSTVFVVEKRTND